MILMKRKDITQMHFTMTLQKMAQQPFTSKTSYRWKKMLDAVNAAKKKVSTEYINQIAKVHGVVDGENAAPDDNEYGFKLKEDVDADVVKKESDAFGEADVEIDRDPLTLADFEDMKVTPAELSALGAVVSDQEPILR